LRITLVVRVIPAESRLERCLSFMTDIGASVAITIIKEPFKHFLFLSRFDENLYPLISSTLPKFVWTSTPTVYFFSSSHSMMRDDVPIPPLNPSETVPVPAPTHSSSAFPP